MLCNKCRRPATVYSTGVSNPNPRRKYYVCESGRCNFWVWSDDWDPPQKWPKCHHNKLCGKYFAGVGTANAGHFFYTCYMGKGMRQCGYWIREDEWEAEVETGRPHHFRAPSAAYSAVISAFGVSDSYDPYEGLDEDELGGYDDHAGAYDEGYGGDEYGMDAEDYYESWERFEEEDEEENEDAGLKEEDDDEDDDDDQGQSDQSDDDKDLEVKREEQEVDSADDLEVTHEDPRPRVKQEEPEVKREDLDEAVKLEPPASPSTSAFPALKPQTPQRVKREYPDAGLSSHNVAEAEDEHATLGDASGFVKSEIEDNVSGSIKRWREKVRARATMPTGTDYKMERRRVVSD